MSKFEELFLGVLRLESELPEDRLNLGVLLLGWAYDEPCLALIGLLGDVLRWRVCGRCGFRPSLEPPRTIEVGCGLPIEGRLASAMGDGEGGPEPATVGMSVCLVPGLVAGHDGAAGEDGA